ncbi:hypothetical protein [Streptomyces fuscichromogenes]|uniref:Uncharacterized protein n=1 Tax=Streptomyces fuscichromogenes TaxID=1324013 RepID=A0A917UHU3_9ACTN|nr:hypothetical protein [Streptomyces fuscichromogenes]GGM96432.1 hypothetical protein GCM10011578_016290 [Streptomyces fuscichromogenes]
MSDTVRIARMRLPRPRHGPPDAYAAVRALDLAPTVPDRSVLVIRRLSVPAAQPGTVRDRVAALRGSAARPALGPTPPDCTAVMFSDEVEAMTCLTTDLLAGRAADRWYWPAEIRRGVHSTGTGTALARIWLDRPAWVPATLAQLARRSPGFPGARQGDAVRATALLSDAEARAVIGAVLAAFHATGESTGLTGLRIGASAEPDGVDAGAGAVPVGAGARAKARAGAGAGAVSAGAVTAADRLSARAPDRPLAVASYGPETTGAALRPAGRALLALALTLAARPWAARDGRLAGEIDDLLRPAAPAPPHPAGPQAYATPDRIADRSTSPGDRQPVDTCVDFGAAESARPASVRPPAAGRPEPAGRPPTTGIAPRPWEAPTDDLSDSCPPGTPQPSDATAMPTAGLQRAEARTRGGSRAVGTAARAGTVIETRFATLFYAVNLMTWLDLPRIDVDADEPGSGPVSGWATLEALGAWLLPDASATGPGTGDRDPIWRTLAELDGRDPSTPASLRLDRLTDRLRDLLDRRRLTPEVFARPGTVVIGRTHVDVLLGLHQIDLAARSSGLDQDPGWVPALGRIIAFHYDGFDHDGLDHDVLDHDGLVRDGLVHDSFDGGN